MAVVISLAIEASTYAGSVAVIDGARVLAERSVAMRGREREALMPAVADVLAEAGFRVHQLDRIVCGAGPGSFTSLRIAGGIAKGLSMAGGIPLVPVSSLGLLVASAEPLAAGRYLGAIDALRGEHYIALFEVDERGAIAPASAATRLPSSALETYAVEQESVLIVAGDQSRGGLAPHARAAARITNMLDATPAADLAAWEPSYGRLAEAQVKWEAAHGRPLGAA